jgi:hypothetical protein
MRRTSRAVSSKPRNTPYRSGLEQAVALGLEAQGVPVLYETEVVEYEVPAKKHKYTPDFILPNGIMIEVKGYLTGEDRTKMKQVKASNPHLDIRFLFGRAMNKLNKKSATTYAKWAEDHGFKWAEKVIPRDWLAEPSKN